MKKNLKVLSAVGAGVAVMALAGQQAQAAPISGTINMSGSVTFNTESLATASYTTTPSPSTTFSGTVSSGTGSYNVPGVKGASVTFNNFTFAKTSPEQVSSLWTFIANGTVYSFVLTAITGITQNISLLDITGTGIVNIGDESQTADWSFVATDTSGGSVTYTFGFSDSNTAIGVPDGGTTVILLGAALSSFALLRNKFAKTA